MTSEDYTKFPTQIFVKFIIFLLPFFQIFAAIFIQNQLINNAPIGTHYDQTTRRGLYVITIRQGSQGSWRLSMPHTTDPQPAVYGQNFFYTVIGQLNRPFQIDAVVLLRSTELLMGILLFITTWIVCLKLFPFPWNIFTYLSTTMIETGMYLGSFTFSPTLWEPSFFMQQTIVERHFGLAHHTFGKIIGIIWLYLFLTALNKRNPLYLIGIFLTAFIGSIVLPPIFVITMICFLIPYGLLYGIWKKRNQFIFASIVSVTALGLTTIFLTYQFSLIPALHHFSQTEKTWWTNQEILLRYASSLLFYYPFIALSLIALITKWNQLAVSKKIVVLSTYSWLLLPTILIIISKYPWFPIVNARLVDGTQYFPAGILSGFSLWWIMGFSTWKKRIFLFFSVTLLIISLFTTYTHTQNFITKNSAAWTNIYPPQELWNAISFYKTLPKGTGILINRFIGEVVISYADVYLFVGSPGLIWPHYERKGAELNWFYSGRGTLTEAKEFLIKNNIQYVHYGREERSVTETPTLYEGLLYPVFNDNTITIYTYNK